MKTLIRGWTRTYSGDGVVLSVPNGSVHVRPGVSPIRAAEAIWRPLVPVGARLEGPFGLVSSEGEIGVIVNAVGETEQTTVAILYGDHTYALIHARTTDAALYATFLDVVRRLAHSQALGLGADRRRRYLYDPPPGWSGIVRPYSTLWLAPDCARQRATLQVFHARPHRNTAPTVQWRQLFEQLSREFGETRPMEPQAIESRFGLRGALVTNEATIAGVATSVSDVGLTDGRLLYLLRLETATAIHARNLDVLRDCVTSVQPIPPPKADADVLIEWFAAT